MLLRAAILRGLKRDADAEGFVKKVLASFVVRGVRDLAERELAAPGTIVNELAAFQERHSKG